MRHPIWTEREGGWSNGPYLIERLSSDIWVLSRDSDAQTEFLASAGSPSELEAFSITHHRVSGITRPLVLSLVYLMALFGVILAMVLGSTIAVLGASAVTVGVIAEFSEYITGRRVVRRRASVPVR